VVVGRDKFYSSGETATLLLVKGNTFTAMGAHNTNPCRSFGPKRNQINITQGIPDQFAPPPNSKGKCVYVTTGRAGSGKGFDDILI
jgi:hypothetical protein